MLSCPKCGCTDLYYTHHTKHLSAIILFPFIFLLSLISFFSYVIFQTFLGFFIILLIIVLLILGYFCLNKYYLKHPYLQVLCKSCGYDWIVHK